MEKKKFCSTTEEYLLLDSELLRLGFKKIIPSDLDKNFDRLDIISPRKLNGKEVSFSYHNQGYTLIVQTTYHEAKNAWAKTGSDAAWVLICKGDVRLYTSRPIRRRGDFINRLLKYAEIAKWKIDNRPLCPSCRGYMEIVRDEDTREYGWECGKTTLHKGNGLYSLSWDFRLPPEFLAFLNIRRLSFKQYDERNKRKGIVRKRSYEVRKKYTIGRPNNIV